MEFETLMLVGKGVTLDTGGADVKVGGGMFGMCRDKFGSAIVASFFDALDKLQPKNLKVIGALCIVRNSIGSNSYTTDEIIMVNMRAKFFANEDCLHALFLLLESKRQAHSHCEHRCRGPIGDA